MDFFYVSWLVALLLAPPAALLGCFIFWRRMAFFTDSLAHASILGLALAFIFDFNETLGIFCITLLITFFIWMTNRRRDLAADAILSITAHSFFALGIISVSLAELRIDLFSYLLGEWLILDNWDMLRQALVSSLVLIVLWLLRKPFLALAVQGEIAQAEGIDKDRLDLLFFLLLAGFITVAVQTVGLLLINALMLMPAAIVRGWVKNPYSMFVASILVACVIMTSGLALSFQLDVPASPAAAVVGGFLFLLSWIAKKLIQGD